MELREMISWRRFECIFRVRIRGSLHTEGPPPPHSYLSRSTRLNRTKYSLTRLGWPYVSHNTY